MCIRDRGDNESLVTALAKDKGLVKIIGLALANGLAALAGAVYCQKNGNFAIEMGTGTMVIGLANVIIGTKLFQKVGILKSTTAAVSYTHLDVYKRQLSHLSSLIIWCGS